MAHIPAASGIGADGGVCEDRTGYVNHLTAYDEDNGEDADFAGSMATRYALAKELYAERRQIHKIFETAGFATSPAWDIMLDLFQAGAQLKSVSVTSACVGAACPATTALRHLRLLERDGFVERLSDPNDKRRAFVALTREGRRRTKMALDLHSKPKPEIED
jgi:DNA-binding MarR family transcriptional regulator